MECCRIDDSKKCAFFEFSRLFLRAFNLLPLRWRAEASKGVLNGLHNRTSSPKRVIKSDLSAWQLTNFLPQRRRSLFMTLQKRRRCFGAAEDWRFNFQEITKLKENEFLRHSRASVDAQEDWLWWKLQTYLRKFKFIYDRDVYKVAEGDFKFYGIFHEVLQWTLNLIDFK